MVYLESRKFIDIKSEKVDLLDIDFYGAFFLLTCTIYTYMHIELEWGQQYARGYSILVVTWENRVANLRRVWTDGRGQIV